MIKRCLAVLTWAVTMGITSTALAQRVGPEFQVNTYTKNLQFFPAVASDAAGNFVVVWESNKQDGSRYGVFGQRYDGEGKHVGPEFRVTTYTMSNQSDAAIAVEPSGNFIVVWSGAGSGDSLGVFGQRFDSGGNRLGGEFRVNTYTSGYQWRPEIAADATGNFVVVWHDNDYSGGQDGSDYGVFGQRFDADGNAVGPEFQVNTDTAGRQWYPRVAADATGNFVVVWSSYVENGGDYGLRGQRYDSAGNRLGGEFQGGGLGAGSVASDPNGNFVIVWGGGQDGDRSGVFGQRYDSSGDPLGGEFQVNTYTTRNQWQPEVALDASGGFVVVWVSEGQDGSGSGLFGQRYDSSGTPRGDEFQVNTYTSYDQNVPSVGSDATGDFIVVWASQGQDGGGPPEPPGLDKGIFGQRFKGEVNPLKCDDVRAVRARCHNGNLQVGFALVDDSHDGERLTLRVNGHDRVLMIQGDRAKASGPGQGLNTLLLVDPADCKEETKVQCP